MTAKQARNEVKKEQYNYVLRYIKYEINESNLSLFLRRQKLFPETVTKLKKNGYIIEIQDNGVFISW